MLPAALRVDRADADGDAVVVADAALRTELRPVEVGRLLQRRHEMRLDVGRDQPRPRAEERAALVGEGGGDALAEQRALEDGEASAGRRGGRW